MFFVYCALEEGVVLDLNSGNISTMTMSSMVNSICLLRTWLCRPSTRRVVLQWKRSRPISDSARLEGQARISSSASCRRSSLSLSVLERGGNFFYVHDAQIHSPLVYNTIAYIHGLYSGKLFLGKFPANRFFCSM